MTKNGKHTPGPWKADGLRITSAPHTFIVLGEVKTASYGHIIADVIEDNDQIDGKANAILIAASPDILEALASLRKYAVGLAWEPMGGFGDDSDWFQCSYCRARSRGAGEHTPFCVMTKAANAIAKARGVK